MTHRQTDALDPTELYLGHQVEIWRYLRALGCTSTQAEDLTQETFVEVLTRPFEYRGPQQARGYLRRVARSRMLMAARKDRRIRYALADKEADVVFEAEWKQLVGEDSGEDYLAALNRCFSELDARARYALDLRFRDDLSLVAIGEEMQISESGAKKLIRRAKARLKRCIEQKIKTRET